MYDPAAVVRLAGSQDGSDPDTQSHTYFNPDEDRLANVPSTQPPAPPTTLEHIRDNHNDNSASTVGNDQHALTSSIAYNREAFTANALPVPPRGVSVEDRGPVGLSGSTNDKRHSRTASAGLHLTTDIHPPTASTTPIGSASFPSIAKRSPASETPEGQPAGLSSSLSQSSLSSSTTFGTFSPSSAPAPSYFNLHISRSAHDMGNPLSPRSASALPSPALSAMIDISPLPSPIFAGDDALSHAMRTRRHSRTSSLTLRPGIGEGISRSNSLTSNSSPPKRKKAYGSLMPATVEAQAANAHAEQQTKVGHTRNRSISDFVPEALQNVRQRVATFDTASLESSGANSHATTTPPRENQMHREEYLAAQRGLTAPQPDPSKAIPSPPPSNKSLTESEIEEDDIATELEEPGVEYVTVRIASEHRKRRWRSIRQLGQGTFSKVLLATSERLPPDRSYEEKSLDPRKLVAVKICEHGPAGGADEERIKHSLDREVEILKSVSHPSIVHLKAMEELATRTYLVLTYCPGGDLFEFASQHRDLLTPNMVQRMFAELVGAVRYLHKNWIVHRDIKLENVLVNLPLDRLTATALPHPQSHPSPIVTITDLGLSRRIPPPPASPLLSTRCGSEDYAAPEILLGQPYDGRSTDGWALGVLLYALMEGRLPFDAPPGKPERSRNTHRIARCDWIWCRFGDEDGEWNADAPGAAAWEGARGVVEALLKKVRMGRKGLDVIEEWDFVREGVVVEGGLGGRGGENQGEAHV